MFRLLEALEGVQRASGFLPSPSRQAEALLESRGDVRPPREGGSGPVEERLCWHRVHRLDGYFPGASPSPLGWTPVSLWEIRGQKGEKT